MKNKRTQVPRIPRVYTQTTFEYFRKVMILVLAHNRTRNERESEISFATPQSSNVRIVSVQAERRVEVDMAYGFSEHTL
jgi:hypothetical protein